MLASFGLSSNDPGYIVYSENSGTNWTVSPSYAGWNTMDSSASGEFVVVCGKPGDCYISRNYGATFTKATGSLGLQNWASVTMDASGQKIWAACEDG